MEDFSDEPDIGGLMLLGMKDDTNWKSLGTLTAAIACRLARGQAELKKDGGTASAKPTSAAAKCPPGRSARPKVKGAAIANRQTIALTAGERVAAATKAGRTRAAASGPTAGGERRAGNVIDYREQPRLLVAWGAFDKPRHRALPTSYARTTSSADRSSAKAKSSSDAPNRTATTPK